MKLTKQSISDLKHIVDGLDGYSLLVSKIENNVGLNPDVAIESCKSLIEGICKKSLELLDDEYNSQKSIRKDCDNKFPFLIRRAFDKVYRKPIEAELHYSLCSLIEKKVAEETTKTRLITLIDKNAQIIHKQVESAVTKISVIRDNRGEVSHGRIYPKKEESSIQLAKSILSITDGICSFMIFEMAEQYKIKMHEADKLIYSDLEAFNNWLNDKLNVLSVKVDFSRQLFVNAYDKYEEYYSEYLEVEISDEQQEEGIQLDIKIEPIEKGMSFEEWFQKQIQKPSTLSIEESRKLYEKYFSHKEDAELTPVELVSTFNSKEFWTPGKKNKVNDFIADHNLKEHNTYIVIEEVLAFDKKPLRDELIDMMEIKPSLKERGDKAENLHRLLLSFIEELNNIEE